MLEKGSTCRVHAWLVTQRRELARALLLQQELPSHILCTLINKLSHLFNHKFHQTSRELDGWLNLKKNKKKKKKEENLSIAHVSLSNHNFFKTQELDG